MATEATIRIIASAQPGLDDYLELIRNDDGRTALCRCCNGVGEIAREFAIDNTVYRAADVKGGIPRQMLLPSRISNYKSFDTLVEEMIEVSCRYCGISDSEAEKGALFALSTFVGALCDPSPRAVLVGNDSWQAARYEKVLARLCRQSLHVANVSAAHLCNLPLGCSPTMLIGSPRPGASLINFVDTTQHGVTLITARGQTITPRFSAVIIDGNNPKFELPSSFLRIDTTQISRTDLFNQDAERRCARLQNQLLSWHFDWLSLFRQKRRPVFDFGGSTSAWADVLTSCVPDSEQWNKRVAEALTSQDEARLLDPSMESQAVVVDALLVLCHQQKAVVGIGELAETANGILELRDDGYTLTDRRVGSITTSLGLRGRNEKRGNTGYKVTLTAAVKRRIHELGRSLNVPFFTEDIQPCEFCKLTAPAAEQPYREQ